jgi:quinol monooxygenase YgiN
MWEATLDPAYADEVAAALVAEVGPWTAREVHRSLDRPSHLVVISHWPDEAALAAYAGRQWRTDPAAELAALPPAARPAGPARVWHFTPVTT